MAPKTKGLSNTNQCRASNLHGCGFDATKALILFFPRSGADLDQLGWSQQRLRQLRRINQPLDEWQKPPHRLAMKQQTSGDQRRVWNRRAAARADVDLPSAAGHMQAAHLLHRAGIPNLFERRLADVP